MTDQNSNNVSLVVLPVLISSILTIIALLGEDPIKLKLVEDFVEYHLTKKQTIKTLSKEFCLASKPKSNTNIVVSKCDENKPNQQFRHMSDGTIRTHPKHCLQSNPEGKHTPILVWDCNEEDSQKFNHKEESDGTIRTYDQKHCLDTKDFGDVTLGTEIVTLDCDGKDSQKFLFEDL